MLKSIRNSDKFTTDLLWNIGSFAMIAIMGILLNIIILKQYGTATLGVFNQVYAIYLLLSQLAVSGVHLAVQRFTPVYANYPAHIRIIAVSALLISSVTSLLVIGAGYLFYKLPELILQSKKVGVGYMLVIPGLLFFSWNKVLLSFHNGCRRMKAFAVFNFMRMLGILSGLILFVINGWNADFLPIVLVLSELLLFCLVFVYSFKYFLGSITFKRLLTWMRIQFKFGNKALLGNFMLDVNTKVDVFMLGIYLNDSMVGIYSFAASFAEGFMQLPVIFRNNLNPVLSKLYAKRNTGLFGRVVNKAKKRFFYLIGSAALLTIIAFPFLFGIFSITEHQFEMWVVLAVLVGFTGVTSAYQPLLMIFNQCGMPWLQTRFILVLFVANVVLNSFLIPVFGVYGAALATGLSMIVQIAYQRMLVLKHLKLRI
jgi:O-antigen/teichoic acid export membrane protein